MRIYQFVMPIAVFLIICMSGCSKEFTPETDLEDKPVVYSIINHHDSKHYIRISRSFIQAITGETISAPVYNPDSLDVFLEVYRFDQKVGYTIFMTPEFVEKDTGLFEASSQLIYSTDVDLVGDSECKLTILNRENGDSYSASCNIFSLTGFKPLVVSNLSRLNFNSIPRSSKLPSNSFIFNFLEFRRNGIFVAECFSIRLTKHMQNSYIVATSLCKIFSYYTTPLEFNFAYS